MIQHPKRSELINCLYHYERQNENVDTYTTEQFIDDIITLFEPVTDCNQAERGCHTCVDLETVHTEEPCNSCDIIGRKATFKNWTPKT